MPGFSDDRHELEDPIELAPVKPRDMGCFQTYQRNFWGTLGVLHIGIGTSACYVHCCRFCCACLVPCKAVRWTLWMTMPTMNICIYPFTIYCDKFCGISAGVMQASHAMSWHNQFGVGGERLRPPHWLLVARSTSLNHSTSTSSSHELGLMVLLCWVIAPLTCRPSTCGSCCTFSML
jgi:hypothetical protein